MQYGHNYVFYTCTLCGNTNLTYSDIPNILDIETPYYNINSVGGIEWNMVFENKSTKTINYIEITMKFKNAVGDYIRDEISGRDYAVLTFTGPLKSGKTSSRVYWNPVFYNYTFSGTIDLTEVKITYQDGTVLVIGDEYADDTVVSFR